METQHTETVVEKVTHYVKDMLGIPDNDVPADAMSKPDYEDLAPALHFNDEAVEETRLGAAPTLTTLDAMRIEPVPHDETAPYVEPLPHDEKNAAELNAESARREDGV